MGTSGLAAWIAAHKLVVACTAAAVVTTGGAAAVVLPDRPPTVEVEALEAAPVAEPVVAEKDEPAAAVEEKPAPEVEKVEKDAAEEPAPEKTEEAAAEAGKAEKTKDEAEKDEESVEKDQAEEKVREKVDVAVSVRGDAERTVVQVHNRGTVRSDRVKVKLLGHAAEAKVRVVEASSGADCGSWYCWFDGLEPGESVATVVFASSDITCRDRSGAGKVVAHYEGHDSNWDNNYGRVDWCSSADVKDEKPHDGKAGKADLSLTVTGTTDEFVVRVHNAGPERADRVKVKMHRVDGAEGTITVRGTDGPVASCDGWYCYFEDVPVGENVATVRFQVDVRSCWHAEGGAKVEVHSETDPNDGNDRQWVRWCSADDVEQKPTADLAVDVEGNRESYRVRVTNVSDQTATDVHLHHWIKDGEAAVTVLESSDPAVCANDGCWLDELAPGQSAWLRVSSTVDCDKHPGTRAKGYVESGSHDGNGDNDWRYLELC